MTLAVFDINDSGIGHGTSPDNWTESPGYALLQNDGVTTGEAARKSAWLQPQQSFQQYWRQLNLAPLSSHNRVARHHADLAYAQLQQLYRDTGEPDEVVLAVPGSFDRDQLALLLGLAKASPFQAVGLVDSAVAAVSQAQDNHSGIHIDIELHQCVLTHLKGGEDIQSEKVEPVHEPGLKGLMDCWAHYLADEFIHQYRYDPLHTAAGEQQLYDQLPGWLQALHSAPQITASLNTPKGDFHLQLLREELLAATRDRLQRLADAVQKQRNGNDALYLSHRLARLLGAADLFPGAHILPEQAVLTGCLAHIDRIRSDVDSLSYITRLPANRKPAPSKATSSTTAKPAPPIAPSPAPVQPGPTHALYQNQAIAIGQLLGFRLGENGLEPCRNAQQADLSLSLNGSGLTLHAREGVHCDAPHTLETGSTIRLNDQEIRLIEVKQ